MLRYLTLLWLAAATTGCASVPKLLEQGRPTDAYHLALKRVRSGPARPEELEELYLAFDALQAADYHRLALVERRTDAARWPILHGLLQELYGRAQALNPYLPVGAPTNYRGGLTVTQLGTRLEEARVQAGEYYRQMARGSLPYARAGDKLAARTAHHHAGRALGYLPEAGSELRALRAELRELGIVHVALQFTVPDILLEEVLDDALARYSGELDDHRWTKLYLAPPDERTDVVATLHLQDWYEDGPTESSSTTVHTAEVLDYIEEQEYEERINDSTVVTKVRQIEHYVTVRATVTEVRQTYAVHLNAELVLDLPRSTSFPIDIYQLRGDRHWTNDYSFGAGDERALPIFDDSGGAQWPPDRRELLRGAVRELLDDTSRRIAQREVVEKLPRGVSLGTR